jgi:hypothetical protein
MSRNEHFRTPLHFAVEKREIEIVDLQRSASEGHFVGALQNPPTLDHFRRLVVVRFRKNTVLDSGDQLGPAGKTVLAGDDELGILQGTVHPASFLFSDPGQTWKVFDEPRDCFGLPYLVVLVQMLGLLFEVFEAGFGRQELFDKHKNTLSHKGLASAFSGRKKVYVYSVKVG